MKNHFHKKQSWTRLAIIEENFVIEDVHGLLLATMNGKIFVTEKGTLYPVIYA